MKAWDREENIKITLDSREKASAIKQILVREDAEVLRDMKRKKRKVDKLEPILVP
jgi:hypothetical protein